MVIFLTFSPIFVILSISYEGLFYVIFCLTLVTWVRLEHKIHLHSYQKPQKSPESDRNKNGHISHGRDKTANPTVTPHNATATLGHKTLNPQSRRGLVLGDARIALFFFFLIQVAFFGTGNIASISSFSLDSVYRLIPVFSPFAMSALLIFKLMIPFAIISANLGILNRRIGVAPSSLFMVVMAISDVLTLNFFYMVRDEGSWLDIGTTISHFCISSLLGVFVSALEFLSEVFVAGVSMEGGYEESMEETQGAPLISESKLNGMVTNGDS